MWTKEKPKIDKPCLLICMHEYPDEYSIFEVEVAEWGELIVSQDGEYWGEIEELSSKLYFVVPLPDLSKHKLK